MNLTHTFNYGPIGIELDRAMERRDTEIHQAAIISTLRLPSRITIVRQHLGDAMIRLGASIAGEARHPGATATSAHPAVDIA